MRTIKALACAAALVAGLATAVAQSNVYSLNVVGYYNVTVAPGAFTLIANQLNTTNNTVANVFSSAGDCTLYKYSGGSWLVNGYSFGSWDHPEWTLNPGEAVLFQDGGSGQTVTFVGEVLQGLLTNPVGLTLGDGIHNLAFVSSMVPQAGNVTDFMVPVEEGDSLWAWKLGTWAPDSYSFGSWGGGGGNGLPFAVGEGFAYVKGPGTTSSAWVRNFTVQ